jgi:CTP:molybdopterin cytidylyltransferase MocA
MASSIRTGVARLPASCTAVLLMLVDQAAVTAEDLERLVGAWRRQPDYIVAARYRMTTGVPAIFPCCSAIRTGW